MDGARRPTSSPQQVPAPLLSWLQSSYPPLTPQEQQQQQQQQRLDQQQFQEQQQHGARLGQQFQQPHPARLGQYQQYQQPQRFHEPMSYVTPELFPHSLLPDPFDVSGAAGRPQLLSPYHQSHKEQLPPTLRHGARQGDYEGHGTEGFPLLHNFQRPGLPMSSQDRSPKDHIGIQQPSPEHVRSPVSAASSCVDVQREMVEAALSPNPVNLSDRNYRPKDEIVKSRNLPGTGPSASQSGMGMIRHMEGSVHNATSLMNNPVGQNPSLGHYSQDSSGSVGHMGLPMYDNSSPAIDRLESSLSSHLGSGSGNTSVSVPQHSVANSNSPYYSEASNLSHDSTRYTDSPSASGAAQGRSPSRHQSREKVMVSESRSAASVISHAAPASKVSSPASAVAPQQPQSASAEAYHSTSSSNAAQKLSPPKKSSQIDMSHSKSNSATSSAKDTSPFPSSTQDSSLASEDSQKYGLGGNGTSSSSNNGVKTVIRNKLLKRGYDREDSSDSGVTEPAREVRSPSTVEDLSTAKIKEEKDDDDDDDTFVFVGISEENKTQPKAGAKNGERDSAPFKNTTTKSYPVNTGGSEEDSQGTPTSVKGSELKVRNKAQLKDGQFSDQDSMSEDDGEVEVGEEMIMSDEFPASDETHFFEDNYPVAGVECPEQVKCYVCDRLVPFGKFKFHLFFGQVHCITCNRRMVGCQMLDDIKDKDRYPCKKSSSKDHSFKNWSVDPIEFLSYYIRKELVIKRFCAGHTGPPPVNEIVDEITAYLKALGSLEAWSPWNIAFAKCHKYIKERTIAAKENSSDAKLSSSWTPDSESPSSRSPQPMIMPSHSHLQNNSVLSSTAAVMSPKSSQPEPSNVSSPKVSTVPEPKTSTNQTPPHKSATVEEESKPAPLQDSEPDNGPATTTSSSVSEKAQSSSTTESEVKDKAKPQSSESDSSGGSKVTPSTEGTATASGSGEKVSACGEKSSEPSVSSRSSTPSSTSESRASSSGTGIIKKYKSAYASKSTGRHGRPFKAYKAASRSTVSDLRTMKTPLVRKDLASSTSFYSQSSTSSSSSSSSSQQHGTSSYLYYWAAPSGTLRTVTFPKPANGNYLVVNYPKNPCPDLCPTCYAPLDPCNMTVNCRTFIMSIVCPRCSLSLFVTQGPPEQLVASDRNKNKRAMSSMNFDAKRRRF